MTEARTTLVPVLLASTGSLYPGVATFIDADAGAADSFSATASGPGV